MDMDDLDLNLLRILEGLYALGTVSGVARRMGVSQPAVSSGLAKLRHFFQDDLFVRTGQGMRPTPFAEELRRPVLETLEGLRTRVLRKAAFEPAQSRRAFTLCMSDVGQLVFVPRLLEVLRREAPDVTLRCITPGRGELEAWLEDGKADLALGYFPEAESANILAQRLFSQTSACLVRQGHPTIGETLPLEQFRTADHIVISQRQVLEGFEMLLRDLGLYDRIAVRLSSYMTAARLVAQSDMICVVPLAVGRVLAEWGSGVRALPVPIAQNAIPLRQLWHRRMHTDAGLVWLRSLVAREFLNRDPLATKA
jgi:DNA-binding transcriptional LysR family regulator